MTNNGNTGLVYNSGAVSGTDSLSTGDKLKLVHRISKNFEDSNLSEFELKLAQKVFLVLANDAELKVRKALAEKMKSSKELPHDLAVQLANDVIDVAEPILSHSPVLSDEDLINLIKASTSVAHKIAISVRSSVSTEVCKAIVDDGDREVVESLISNNGAVLTEEIIMQVLDSFAGSATILESLVKRGDIPLTAVEKMVSLVSGELKSELVTKYKMDETIASKVVRNSQEAATLGLLSLRSPDIKLEDVIEQMFKHNQLSASIVLRSLCIGDVDFFLHSMSKLSGIEHGKALMLIRNKNPESFQAVYRAAKMPMGAFQAVRVLLSLALDERDDSSTPIPQDFQKRMLERIMENGYADSVENMSYIMGILGTGIQSTMNAA